jgi:hypothetical protein
MNKRQTSMPPVGFKLAISTSERPPTYALDHAAAMFGCFVYKKLKAQSKHGCNHRTLQKITVLSHTLNTTAL